MFEQRGLLLLARIISITIYAHRLYITRSSMKFGLYLNLVKVYRKKLWGNSIVVIFRPFEEILENATEHMTDRNLQNNCLNLLGFF